MGDLRALRAVAGWGVFGITLLLGLAGAAATADSLLLARPRPVHAVLVAATVALVLAVAGPRVGKVALGLSAALVLIALAPSWSGARALSGPPLLALAGAAIVLACAREGRAPRTFFLAVLAVYLAAAARVQEQVGPRGDEPHYLMNADSLLRDGDLAVEQDFREGRFFSFHPGPLRPDYILRGRGGVIYSLHSIGVSLLVLPAYALGGYPAASFFIALLAAVAAQQTRLLLRDVVGPGVAAEGVAWVVALGPPLLHFCGLIFTEIPAALIVALGLRHARDLGRLRATSALALGLAVGFLPWLNVRYTPLAAVLFGYGLLARPPRKALLAYLGAGIASAVAFVAYHFVIFGVFDPRRVYGRRRDLTVLRYPEGLPGLLFDQEFGLLVYAPVFALALFGFVPLWRRARPVAIGAIGVTLASVTVAGAWVMWRGGFNPPARFLLPIVPALALAAASALGRGWSAAAALLAGWTVFTGVAGACEPRLVHRDRDGTAPFFRERSGALEWTTLLPGYVLPESTRDQGPLTLVWAGALLLAAVPRRRTGGPLTLGAAGLGLAAAAGMAAALSHTGSEGRDAVRVVGRNAFSLPDWRWQRNAAARWMISELGRPALYEPHREPAGAVLGGRLPLPAGQYELTIEAEAFSAAGPLPTLTVHAAPHLPPAETVALASGEGGLHGSFLVPRGMREATLKLVDGGPLLLHAMTLRQGSGAGGSRRSTR